MSRLSVDRGGTSSRPVLTLAGELDFESAPTALNAAMAAMAAEDGDRGRAGGFVYMSRTDRALEDADLIHERMVVALAGRAAEQIVFGKVSSGAANDLEQVNAIARQAVERLGLSPEVGQIISFNDRSQLSQEALGLVDRVVERFVHAAYEDALELLSENVDSLKRIAELLITQKDLERVDILSAISSPAPSVKLQSGFGTRVEKTGQKEPRRAPAPLGEAVGVRAVRRVREGGGFRLRGRLLGGAGVAAAVIRDTQP